MESMKPSLSRTYVLVHGSFVGAWCWSRVVPELEAAGHEVHAPALTGVGERADEATPQVGLLAHIDQITRLIEANDLRDVVLVGHSYGGMVVAGVACRVPERSSRSRASPASISCRTSGTPSPAWFFRSVHGCLRHSRSRHSESMTPSYANGPSHSSRLCSGRPSRKGFPPTQEI